MKNRESAYVHGWGVSEAKCGALLEWRRALQRAKQGIQGNTGNKGKKVGAEWYDVHRCGVQMQQDVEVGSKGAERWSSLIDPVFRASRVRAFVCASLLHGVSPLPRRPRLPVSQAEHFVQCVSRQMEKKENVKTNLRSSSFITALAGASISSSSLNTFCEMYEFRSLPNSFHISEPRVFPGSDARRFGGGGESEDEGDRGRFLGASPPNRGGAPPDMDPDLAGYDLGTGLLDREDLKAEEETLGIVDKDVLVLRAGLDCEDDLVPDELDAVLPLADDLAGGCDAASA